MTNQQRTGRTNQRFQTSRSMLNLKINHHQLQHALRTESRLAYEAQQVVRRLTNLLPNGLIQAKGRQASRHSKRAERIALIDPTYLNLIHQLIAAKQEETTHRMRYEVYAMLYKARQSTNARTRTPSPTTRHQSSAATNSTKADS